MRRDTKHIWTDHNPYDIEEVIKELDYDLIAKAWERTRKDRTIFNAIEAQNKTLLISGSEYAQKLIARVKQIIIDLRCTK